MIIKTGVYVQKGPDISHHRSSALNVITEASSARTQRGMISHTVLYTVLYRVLILLEKIDIDTLTLCLNVLLTQDFYVYL